ncbi:glutathione peroxidase [Mucilaginibacter sp. RS28]|uniref:Glutathione peroxidase n=1 Tax=Mucilaginibacter straminoryzae TaxID=2932774 RepID=A0A9X1X4B1_9SPHI|nr:glutathione peroxidase [Mucilaginibacter straminoryzae]MCJ8210110.1 glutathione peroxidase [Mucilaginibacter straminoryzae]
MNDEENIYQFNVPQLNGAQLNLEHYRGKVLLIVNTASQCGFTPQMNNLVELKKQFAGKDFEILAFPSNDFGNQEPLDGHGLVSFCTRFDTNFPVFDKVRVRGTYTHPLYRFLADKKRNGRTNQPPRWNFHKYLIDKQGRVVDFFYPFTRPDSSRIRKKINQLLEQ